MNKPHASIHGTGVLLALLVLGLLLPSLQSQAQEQITNATFTTALVGGQPTDYVQNIANSVREVYYYSEVAGLKGKTITHRWQREGEVKAEIKIRIDTDPAQAVSKLKLRPEWTGAWTVQTLDGSGKVIAENSFAYLAPL